MKLENLIQEYLAIPNRLKTFSGIDVELSQISSIANEAKNEYTRSLSFFIQDLIKEENNIETLTYLIEKYSNVLFDDCEMIIPLYKRYLTLDPTNGLYYKNLAELIIFHRSSSTWKNAQEMYSNAQRSDWNAAAENLNNISY